jgi:hypothetical protein
VNLRDWADNGWLRPHQSSPREIESLLAIVDRDLADAAVSNLSADWRFGIAYNAALKLCTILIHASGYRAERTQQHYRTIAALPLVLGADFRELSEYLDACRIKRNHAEYDTAGAVGESEADELIGATKSLRKTVVRWLKDTPPEWGSQS